MRRINTLIYYDGNNLQLILDILNCDRSKPVLLGLPFEVNGNMYRVGSYKGSLSTHNMYFEKCRKGYFKNINFIDFFQEMPPEIKSELIYHVDLFK